MSNLNKIVTKIEDFQAAITSDKTYKLDWWGQAAIARMEELKNELTSENAVEIMKELNELWKTYQDLKTGKEDVVSVLAVTAAKRIVTQNGTSNRAAGQTMYALRNVYVDMISRII